MLYAVRVSHFEFSTTRQVDCEKMSVKLHREIVFGIIKADVLDHFA